MSDEDLAVELCPDDPCLGLIAVSKLDSSKRATLERMIEVADELNLWQAGVGPAPLGVIVNRGKGKNYR